MSMTPEKRFLGIDRLPSSDRGALGLPEDGQLRSGQVEAALEQLVDIIARHPLGGSAEAKRLAARLEYSADRLQAEIALAGKGPLHPAAARRAARRLQASSADAAPGTSASPASPFAAPSAPARPAVVAPAALGRGTGAGVGLTADDLTDFDRVALAVLVVSGGWNATSAKRLATIAGEYGVAVADLEKIVLGLTQFLSEGEGLRGAMGEVGESARTTWMASPRQGRVDAAENAVERVFSRINDVLRDEVGGGSDAARMRLTVIFTLFALSWVAALGYIFFGSSGKGDAAEDAASRAPVGVAVSEVAPPARGDVDANGASVAPIDALAAPAKFPRPPGFTPSPTPPAVIESASAAAVWIADLEEAVRALDASKGRFDGGSDAERATALVSGALARAADAWPAAGGYRADAVRALGAVARASLGADSLRRLMRLVPGSSADVALGTLPAWQRVWRQAFGAGCLASIAVDPTFSPEIAAAAREELRQRNLPIPRGKVADPFGTAAVGALVATAPALAEQIVFGSSSLDDVARWNEAVRAAASTPRMRIDAAIAGIDAVLRAPGALDKPGPLVDTLAFFIRALDFTGRGAESESVRGALATWLLDKNIPPTRIWVLTSLLDADLGIAWYGPDLVLATNAGDDARADLAERLDRAFPRLTTTIAGEAVLLDPEPYQAWRLALDEVWSLESGNEVERLRNAAIALGVMRAYRGHERGDARSAQSGLLVLEEVLSREPEEWISPPAGVRPGLPASGVSDGTFDAEWRANSSAAARLEAVRNLRARPAAGDLGPRDAQVAAREALRASAADVRQELCAVLMDRYSNGPEVLRALLDALAEGRGNEEARLFIGTMADATVAGGDWIADARRALLTKIVSLEDSAANAVDLACADIAEQASALAAAFGRMDAGAAGSAARPERVLATLGDAMRDEAATRFLAEPFPAPVEEIERLRNARRSLARSVTQRMAAETPAILDYAAMLVASRQPSLQSRIAEIVAAARALRAAAPSASDQLMGDLYSALSILDLGLAPKPTERAGG